MIQKFAPVVAIVATAFLGIACFAMFFSLKYRSQEMPMQDSPIQEIRQKPATSRVRTLQLDTVRLGKISPCNDGIVAGNAKGELRFFSLVVDGAEPQVYPLSKYGITAAVLEKNGLCYVGDTNGMFWAFDPATGTVKWSYKTYNQITGQAVWYNDTHNNMLFVGSHDCDLYVFDPETGDLRFTVESGGEINATPIISERLNAVFFGNCNGMLQKVDMVTGTVLGSLDFENHIPASPVIRDDIVYCLTHRGELAAVDAETFKIVYRVKTPNEYFSSPYVTGEFLFLTDYDGKIHVHSRGDGTRLATLPLEETMTPLQAGDDARAFAVSRRGKLFAWLRENDQWHATLLADLQTDCEQSCVLVGNQLLVADESGGLFCVEVAL